MLRRFLFFLLWAGLGGIVISGLLRTKLETDFLKMMPRELSEVEAVRLWRDGFSRPEEFLLLLESDDSTALEEMAQALCQELPRQLSWVERAERQSAGEGGGELASLIARGWLGVSGTQLKALAQRLQHAGVEQKLEESVHALTFGSFSPELWLTSYDPLGLSELPGRRGAGPLAGGSGSERWELLSVGMPPGQLSNALVQERRAELSAVLAQWSQSHGSGVRWGLTGEPAFVAEISQAMERDMRGSVGLILGAILGLFWLFERRLLPLGLIFALLGGVLAWTLAVGGWLWGSLNLLSIGFASVLIGLGVDYGVILYREGRVVGFRRARAQVARSIFGAALTTAAVFFALNAIPWAGMNQWANLVGLGILSAAIGFTVFLPPLLERFSPQEEQRAVAGQQRVRPEGWRGGVAMAALGMAVIVMIFLGLPRWTGDSNSLTLRQSEAWETQERLEQLGGEARDATFFLVQAPTSEVLRQRALGLEKRLEEAWNAGQIDDYWLPYAWVEGVALDASRKETLRELVALKPSLLQALEEKGFGEEAESFLEEVWKFWEGALVEQWPSSLEVGGWSDKFLSSGAGGWTMMGQWSPAGVERVEGLATLEGVYFPQWEGLGQVLWQFVQSHLRRESLWLLLGVGVILAVVLRSVRGVLLCAMSWVVSMGLLLAVMRLLDWQWNAFNLFALPLLLGTTLDYSIHMVLALERERQSSFPWSIVQDSIGRALTFCGLSSALGFAVLGAASHRGLASLGLVCSVGLLCSLFVAKVLLPWGWFFLGKKEPGR